MSFFKTAKLNNNQGGFTLLELTIAMLISGILGVCLVSTTFQINSVSNLDSARVIAVKQVENAIHYVNRDVQMAQEVQTNGTDEDTGEPYWLRVTWTNWEDNHKMKVIYNDLENGNLSRQYIEKDVNNNIVKNLSAGIARFITSTSVVLNTDTSTIPVKKWFTIHISSTASSGNKQATETRKVEIIPRPWS